MKIRELIEKLKQFDEDLTIEEGTMKFPNWVWWILGVMLLIIVCVVCKFNMSIGSEGIHITQGLVK